MKVKCRFYESDGRIFTLSAYVRSQQNYVRLQETYLIDSEFLEFGDGVDIPCKEWLKLVAKWPEIIFCVRFNMRREFYLIDDVNTSLKVIVKKMSPHERQNPENTVMILEKMQILEDGYLLEGKVAIPRFTLENISKYFATVKDSLSTVIDSS